MQDLADFGSLAHMDGMTPSEKQIFITRYESGKRSHTAAFLLALFLGNFGAHHFYLGKIGLGILYAALFWTFIPGLVALVELFFMKRRVEQYNSDLASSVAASIKMTRSFTGGGQASTPDPPSEQIDSPDAGGTNDEALARAVRFGAERGSGQSQGAAEESVAPDGGDEPSSNSGDDSSTDDQRTTE